MSEYSTDSVPANNLPSIECKVLEIIHFTFPEARDIDLGSLNIGCVSQWDSLGQLRLMMEVEKQFKIRIPTEQIVGLNNHNKLVSYLKGAVDRLE